MEPSAEHVFKNPFSQITYKMHLILTVGRLLMENGADSDRTTRYIMRTAAYMGIPAENVSCHIMYTSILLNIKNEERTYTELCKCRKHSVSMSVLAAVSRIIWRAMRDAWSLERFEKELDCIQSRRNPYSNFATAIGSSFACGGSCLLFGGDLIAFFITAVCAFFGFYTRIGCNKRGFNNYAGIAIAAFVATSLAALSQNIVHSTTPMHPIAACALFIVPGVPLINAADDMLNNFIMAGTTRAIHTLLIVGSMAFGTAIALHLGRITDFATISLSPGDIYFYHPLAAAISAGGFSLLFNVPRRVLWAVSVGGAVAILLRNICMFDFGLSQATGTLIGGGVVGIVALSAIHWFHVPNVVLTTPSAIPLVPGILLYRLLFTFLNINDVSTEILLQALRHGIEAMTIIVSIAIGVAIPNIFWSRQIRRNKIAQEKKLLASRFVDQDD